MPTNKNAAIRYQTLDNGGRNGVIIVKKYIMYNYGRDTY